MKWITRPKKIKYGTFFTSAAIAAFLIFLCIVFGLRKIPAPQIWKGQPQFVAPKAFAWAKTLSEKFENRMTWRPERRAAAEYIKGEFRKLGYEPQGMLFSEVIGGKHFNGLENIYAVLPGAGASQEYVVICAHYDITDTTIQGASDDASGVGVVLELARVFKQGPAPRHNIVFLITDSEEFGAFWGAKNFIEKYPNTNQIIAAISLDFVAPDKQKDILILTDGLKEGYTPLWLREMALGSVRKVPYGADDMKHIVEWVQRAILIPAADHGAFLQAGIPALNFFGRSTDFAYEMAKIHHMPEDNMSHLHVESFEPYGKGAETLLRSIDSLASEPPAQAEYLKVTDHHYLTGLSIHLIHDLLFLPFGIYVFILFRRIRKNNLQFIRAVAWLEIKKYGALFGSLLTGYGALRLLPRLNIITRYELFPATQKSILLYHPKWGAILLIFAVVVGANYFLNRFFTKREERWDAAHHAHLVEIRHCLMGIILGVIIFLAFLENSWAGTLLLIPPAYLWMFMKNNRRFDSKLLNALLFFGGLISFVALCMLMAMIFHVGIFYWYLFLASAYGLISMYAAILAFAVIAVGVRIVKHLIW